MNALIIGGSRGIGAATAELLRRNGWSYSCPNRHDFDVSADAALATVRIPVEVDLNALIYCAGEWHSSEFSSPVDSAWLRQYNLSVIGLHAMLCLTLPQLTRANGCVVAVSSTRGLIGGVKTAAYSCGKAAQIALMQGFAREYQGVRFNTVCPGLTDTEMGKQVRESGGCKPDAKAQKPEAVAAAIVRLIESDANGKVIKVVDGKESEVAWQ